MTAWGNVDASVNPTVACCPGASVEGEKTKLGLGVAATAVTSAAELFDEFKSPVVVTVGA